MANPRENDKVTGNKGTYVIGKFISKGPSALSHEATDSSGKKVFLKAYLSPAPSSGMYDAYLDYELELNRRLEADKDLKQISVYALDIFSSKLESDGIIRPFPMLFQVFPFVSGNINLDDLIGSGIDGRPLTWKERMMVATIFTYAMSRLHAVKIVHADLKPENVQMTRIKTPDGSLLLKPLLVDMDGSVLADRLAPWRAKDKRTGEKYGGYIGTNGYFSPEHLRGETPVPASDVFTSAIILCQLLAGVHPFASSFEADSVGYPKAAVKGKHDFLEKKIPFIGGRNPNTDALEEILLNALKADPAKRPTMNDIHEAVVRLKNILPPPPKCPVCKQWPCVCKKESKCPVCGHWPCICKKESKCPVCGHFPCTCKIELSRLVLTGDAGQFSTGGSIGPDKTILRRVIGDDARYTDSTPQFSLTKEDGHWFVAPTSAKNPTFLNGHRLTEKCELKTGDRLSIGRVGIMKVSFTSCGKI